MIVEVDSKMRDRIDVAADISEDDAIATAKASPKVAAHLDGREVVRAIAKPPRVVNLLTR